MFGIASKYHPTEEKKTVAPPLGKGGQALAAINAAAGVSTQIDQSTKQFGYSNLADGLSRSG